MRPRPGAAACALLLVLAGCRSPDARAPRAGPLVLADGQTLSRVRVSAPPGEGPVIRVPAGVRARLDHVTVEATGRTAIRVEGTLEATALDLRGGAPGLQVAGGTVRVEDLRIVGTGPALRLEGGEAELRAVFAQAGEAPVLFAAAGRLAVTAARLRGGEYGVLTRPGVELSLRSVHIEGPTWAGLGLVGARARLHSVVIQGPARHGGLLANDLPAPLVLGDVTVRGVTGAGVQVIRGDLEARRLRIEAVAADGQGALGAGLHLDASTASVQDLDVIGAAGEGVLALGGRLDLTGALLRDAGAVGLSAQRGARVRLAGVTFEGAAPRVAASEDARVESR